MLLEFFAYAVVAAICPSLIPGVKVKNFGTAILIALVFAVLNMLIGWLVTTLITLLSIPLILLTLGLFAILIQALVNMILLMVTDALLEDFELEGWLPAFMMAILFAITRAFF